MVRIRIGSTYLDVPADTKAQLIKKNILFAFDDAACERSTSFDLPATDTNNAALGISGDYHNAGAGMRKQYDAIFEVNGMQTAGKLHITQYDAKKRVYSCIFVGGILYDLVKIKALGKIKDFYIPNTVIRWMKSAEKDANTTLNTYDIVKYLNEWEENNPTAVALPSIDLHALITALAAQVNVQTYLPSTQRIRYIPTNAARVEDFPLKVNSARSISGTNINTPTNNQTALITNMRIPYNANKYIAERPDPQYPLAWYYYSTDRTYNLAGWMPADDDILLTFPEDFPSTVICATELCPTNSGALEYVADALGDYNARIQYTGAGVPQIEYVGQPLAGRTIYIQQGTRFAFVDIRDWSVKNPRDYSEGDIVAASLFVYVQPYHLIGQRPYEYTLQLAQANERHPDTERLDGISMWAVLPDVTFMELCKAYAAMVGCFLFYSPDTGLSFISGDNSNLFNREIDTAGRVLSVGKVTRRFSDYAQHNYIHYCQDDSMLKSEQISRDYPIINANIDTEKDLAEIPFSSGGQKMSNGALVAYVRDNENMENVQPLAMRAGSNSAYMVRKAIPQMSVLSTLCYMSTASEIEMLMPAFEFESLTGRELFIYDACKWVWTSAQWESGKCRLNLQKYA